MGHYNPRRRGQVDNLTRNKKTLIATTTFLFAVVLILCAVLPTTTVAYAEFPTSYSDYISSLPSTDDKDWYFGENYLDLDYCISVVNEWKKDSSFDWDKLKNDPIVIAVVDSGIGYAYTVEDGVETEVSVKDVYADGNSYKISSVFDDVLLTDADGNYIYKNVTSKVSITEGKNTKTQTAVTDSGNIALDLVDNTDNNHGTHVTGTVALLIRAFGLEDYVKILPIKANNKLTKETGKTQFVASYDNGNDDPVVTNALYFAEENGADIVNLSLAAEYKARSYYTFDAFENEMLIVAAAGNSGKDSDRLLNAYYPAACDGVIGVMNYTRDDDGNAVLSSKSNYGSNYNVAAPGTDVVSIIDGDDGYGKLSGTSMASPIVSFCSALTLLRYRGYESETGVEMSTELLRAMINACPSYSTADSKAEPVISLKNLLTEDFLNDEKYSDVMYTDVTGIKIATDASNKLTLGDDDVYFKAVPIPSNAKSDFGVRWYLKRGDVTTDLGDGQEIYLTVPTEVGEGYALYCEYYEVSSGVTEYVSEPFEFSVNYKEFKANDVIEFDVTETENGAIFSIDLDGYKPSIADGVVWYVNGKEVGRGETFDYVANLSAGDYLVTVSVWGTKVGGDYTLSISAPEPEQVSDLVYVLGIGVCALALVASIIGFVISALKKKKGEVVDMTDADENEFMDSISLKNEIVSDSNGLVNEDNNSSETSDISSDENA